MKKLSTIVLSCLLLSAPFSSSLASSRSVGTHANRPRVLSRASMQFLEGGNFKCRDARPDEAIRVMRSHSNVGLHELTNLNAPTNDAGGLKITMRGTTQLENFPGAKAAFLKAASTWESIIRSPIAIVVDVDFGPNHFGEPFEADTLGLTSYQAIGFEDYYTAARGKLIAAASTPEQKTLYDLLPADSIPTDIGNTTAVYGPTSVFRSLGEISPIADPEVELGEFGPAPTISFNSAFAFDFDPDDGLDEEKTNFLSVAEHEIGHLLGFFTMTGLRELYPDDPLGVSVWDLFRLRPGVTAETFGSAQRILSSGGEQIFFNGREEVQLSTGRPDQTGGDEQQPSHWKADELSDVYIGVMDPTLDDGEVNPITHNDLDALEAMGYRIARDREGTPAILEIAASLDGDTLTLSGTAADRNGDIVQAKVRILDGKGATIGESDEIGINVAATPQANFSVEFSNLSLFPTATQASLILIDRDGNTSAPIVAGFSEADPGGPVLSSVSYAGKKLKMVGAGFDGDLALEINGVIVAEGPNDLARKAVVKSRASFLNILTGPNRVRLRKAGLWSNIYIFYFEN